MRCSTENTASRVGKSQGIEHDRQLGRKRREKTVRGGEAGLRKERNKELTSKRAPMVLTPLPKSHKLAIDLRSPITPIQFAPPVPVAVPHSPVLDLQAMRDSPPAPHLLPTSHPIMYTIKVNSSSSAPLRSERKRSKCHSWERWAPQSTDEWTSANSSTCTKSSHSRLGPIRGSMISPPSNTMARNCRRKQSKS